MDAEDIYDEFGNLIGDAMDSDAESYASSDNEPEVSHQLMEVDEEPSGTVVLAEDKHHYSSLSETYGAGVETIVQTFDSQSLLTPIIQPAVEKRFKIEEDSLPKVAYARDYLLSMINTNPERTRNVALVGSVNSGKTTFLDMLVMQSHPELQRSKLLANFKPLRYTDNHTLEVARGMTLKVSPVTLLLPNLKGNLVGVTLIDTPGHVNFLDEVAVAQLTADVCVVVIDVVEGVTCGAELALKNAVRTNMEVKVVLNKIDRLVLELKMTPTDAYLKLRHILQDLSRLAGSTPFSPLHENVCFAAASSEFSFTLQSFVQMYVKRSQGALDASAFTELLWGDVYYDPQTNQFTRTNNAALSLTRTFVHFVLAPLFKLFTHSVTVGEDHLAPLLRSAFNVLLPKAIYKLDAQILVKEVMKAVFGESTGFVEMLQHGSSPVDPSARKIERELGQPLSEKLVVHLTKLVDTTNAESFYGLVRVHAGTLTRGATVKVLGTNFDEDTDDFHILTIDELYLGGGRYRVPVDSLGPGAIGLIGNEALSTVVAKGATIVSETSAISRCFLPIDYLTERVFKVAIEPVLPSELPKLLAGLRAVNKSYPGLEIRVEENGEHVLFGSGELYMDCVLHDLRQSFTGIELKVSDPITRFSEACLATSFTKIRVTSTNGKNWVSVIAEPLAHPQLAQALEAGEINFEMAPRVLAKVLRQEFGLDALTARSLWSAGPDNRSSNVLQDDTLPLDDPESKARFMELKGAFIQGFRWATREGPLCDEPMRATQFRILECELSDDLLSRSASQIIPMMRKACYAAFMTATPILLEPVYSLRVTCGSEAGPVVSLLVSKRRGTVAKQLALPGSPFFEVYGTVPVIDAVGLESDIRLATGGQAVVSLVFSKWGTVPGDPLDKDCFIPQLRPAPYRSLSRDFVTKTRKRKGLGGEPGLDRYVPKEVALKMRETGLII